MTVTTALMNIRSIALVITTALCSLAVKAADELKVEELARGLNHPWGMAFIAENELILTERSGQLRRFHFGRGLSAPLTGVPAVVANNQGGLLDVAVDPDFADNQRIFFCYSRAGNGGSSSSVATAILGTESLTQVTDIFIADSVVDNGFHFGCRLSFDQAKNLFIGLGDRYKYMDEAQNTDNHFGKIVRISRSGQVPVDNPFINGKAPEIYSYGHRNIQGLTTHPSSGELWAMEHGPKGGDEVNLIVRGNNYGWPLITYGVDYSGAIISDKTALPGMEQPIVYWVPSIAPSGMAFYHGEHFAEWQGDLLVGALKGRHLRRIVFDESATPTQQITYLRHRKERIRDVEIGPDGLIYLLTDETNGKLLRLSSSAAN